MTDPATSATGEAPLLSVRALAAAHGGRRVFEGVAFDLARGEIAALLGPSGTGKTTLLRCIAGLHPVAGGELVLRGKDASATPPERRGVGFVFQDLALFPHLDAAGNIGFGLSRWPRHEREARVADLLGRIGLDGLGGRMPDELSGGQRQRVALARSLAPKPDLLLLDEPLSGLDADLRPRLRDDLRALLRAEGTAALLVTHDQDEAFAFADTVGVMLEGRLAAWSTGPALYHQPPSEAVARFIGDGRLVPVLGRADGALDTPLGIVRPPTPSPLRPGHPGVLLVRPDDLLVGDGDIEASILASVFHGADCLHHVRLDDGTELRALAPSHRPFARGDRVRLRPDLAHVVVFPR